MAKYTEWLTDEGLLKIGGWARDGLSDKQIAQNIGVAYSTFREWVKKFPALSASLKEEKEVVDRIVENALFRKAVGYDYEEKTYKIVTVNEKRIEEKDGKRVSINIPVEKEVLVKKTTKHVPPDTTAQIFWLKNRKPDEWRDKQVLQHDGKIGLDFETKEEAAKAYLDGIVKKAKRARGSDDE